MHSLSTYSIRVRLVRLQLGMVRVLDENVTTSQLSRRAVAEIVDHGNSRVFVRHFQKRLYKINKNKTKQKMVVNLNFLLFHLHLFFSAGRKKRLVDRPPDECGQRTKKKGNTAHLVFALEDEDVGDASEWNTQMDNFSLRHVVGDVADVDDSRWFGRTPRFQFHLASRQI